MTFLRNILATLVGLFIFSFLLVLIFLGIASIASSSEVPTVNNNAVLYLNLSGVIVEKAIDDPLQGLLGNKPAPLSLMDVLASIKAAKSDDRIKGIYIESGFMVAGQSTLKEVREALLDFKSSEKFVYAYGEYVSEANYYLLSVADEIYLHPEGSLEFNGISAHMTFFKGLFDKLDIEPEIFRVGQYKSYVEPFIRKDLSPENREQLSSMIGSIYSTYLDGIGSARNIPSADLHKTSDKMLIRFPEDAVAFGLVSKVGHEDEIKSIMKGDLGLKEDQDINFISIHKYGQAIKDEKTAYSANKIAVIVANGEIIMGKADDAVGGEQFAREIRNARESKSIKAIVLRVNSPGGSLTASDMIWREIQLTRGVKPIIASMSDVAASGGYYISSMCDTIVAQPNTITGSIGIFGMIFNFGDFLENKLGITNDVVNTGEFSDMFTVTRSLTPQERGIIQSQVDEGYETFLLKVSEGRKLPIEDVEKVAGGRVWTGEQALSNGLVDVLGSFDDAVQLAAEKSGVSEDYRLSFYPRQQPFLEELLNRLNDEANAMISRENILSPYIRKIESLQRMTGMQIRMPGDLQVY